MRSIAYLIDQFPDLSARNNLEDPTKVLKFLSSKSALKKSGFNFHVYEDDLEEVLQIWKKVKENRSTVAFLKAEEDDED